MAEEVDENAEGPFRKPGHLVGGFFVGGIRVVNTVKPKGNAKNEIMSVSKNLTKVPKVKRVPEPYEAWLSRTVSSRKDPAAEVCDAIKKSGPGGSIELNDDVLGVVSSFLTFKPRVKPYAVRKK